MFPEAFVWLATSLREKNKIRREKKKKEKKKRAL